MTSIGRSKIKINNKLNVKSKRRLAIEFLTICPIQTDVNEAYQSIALQLKDLYSGDVILLIVQEGHIEPQLSILIPVYNGAPFIRGLVQSILDNPFTDFELLILDDGSFDQTVTILKEFEDTRIRFFRFETNQGAGIARNFLLKQARGQFVGFQDADDSFDSQRFVKQVRYLVENPAVDGVGTWAKLEWKGEVWGEINSPQCPNFFHWAVQRSLVHASLVLRKEVALKASYHEELRIGEDYYFLTQLYVNGAKFENLREALYTYHVDPVDLKMRKWRYSEELQEFYKALRELYPSPQKLGFRALCVIKGLFSSLVSRF